MSDDLYRQIQSLETSQNELAKELRTATVDTNKSINKLTNDINLLVSNMGHLTQSIEAMSRIIDRTHQIELDLVTVKDRTDTIKKLWDIVDDLKEKVAAQSPISNAVKIIGVTVLTSSIALVFSIVSSGGLGG